MGTSWISRKEGILEKGGGMTSFTNYVMFIQDLNLKFFGKVVISFLLWKLQNDFEVTNFEVLPLQGDFG